jgi:1-deoxy-D-xylulose-5-phosphate synthase
MAEGTGLLDLARAFPDRVFDVGIAEQHALTFAAALAAEGRYPVVALYSTFLQRAYDQLIHDVALQGLPVTLLVDRAGLVGQDGPTHHGAFDLAYLSAIPGLEIWAPATADDLEEMLELRFASGTPPRGPLAIRYPRGRAPRRASGRADASAKKRAESEDLLVVAVGTALERAEAALARLLPMENDRVRVLSWTKLAPVQSTVWDALSSGHHRRVLWVEDGTEKNGVSAALLASFSGRVLGRVLGLPHRFVEHGTVAELERELGLDRDGILAAIRGELESL